MAFNCFIFSHISPDLTTECIEHQPFAASGIIVGLLIEGKILIASSVASSGKFISRYLRSLLSSTASKRKSISSSREAFSAFSFRPGTPISTASEKKTFSTSLRPLEMRVPPVETISNITSAIPAAGAISTEPAIKTILASTPLLSKKRLRIAG